MFDRIVVPLNGSAFAEAALIPARELAGRFGSKLLLTTAVEPLRLPPIHPQAAPAAYREEGSAEQAEQVDEMDAYLHEQVDELRKAGYEADLTLFIAAPGAGISGTAELNHADLIVIATRLAWTLPLEGPHRSSVTLDVLARSRVPILSCHLVPTTTTTPVTPPQSPKSTIPQLAGPELPIVVPLDGSPFALQALAPAEALARAFGTYLVLVQALPPHTDGSGTQQSPGSAAEQTAAGQREAREYLARLRTDLESGGISATTVVEVGVPINVIEHTWREHNAGLIVMASHGQSGHGQQQLDQRGTSHVRPLVGSVAAAILEELEVPTLVIQPAL